MYWIPTTIARSTNSTHATSFFQDICNRKAVITNRTLHFRERDLLQIMRTLLLACTVFYILDLSIVAYQREKIWTWVPLTIWHSCNVFDDHCLSKLGLLMLLNPSCFFFMETPTFFSTSFSNSSKVQYSSTSIKCNWRYRTRTVIIFGFSLSCQLKRRESWHLVIYLGNLVLIHVVLKLDILNLETW